MDFYKQRAAAAAAAPPALATATSNDLAAMGVELNTEGNLFSGGEARDRRSKRKRGGRSASEIVWRRGALTAVGMGMGARG